MTTEPIEPSSPKPQLSTETQQQLAQELEKIAANQLQNPDDETDVVLLDAEQPENETTKAEFDKKKLELEKAVSELQQLVMNAMVDFSQRVGLINTEAVGDEHMSVDKQFTRYIQRVREAALDQAPQRADTCWEIGNDARTQELTRINKLDNTIRDVRDVLLTSAQRTVNALEVVRQAVTGNDKPRDINDAIRDADKQLVDGLDYSEKTLANIPVVYGEITTVMEDALSGYIRLLRSSKDSMNEDELEPFRQLRLETYQSFDRQMGQRAANERERLAGLSKDMHDFYANTYRQKINELFLKLEAQE